MRTSALLFRSFRTARRAATLAAMLLSLTAGSALARPEVTVAEFGDSTRQGKAATARVEIVRALQDDDKVGLVSWVRVVEVAAKRGVRGKALTQPETVGPLAKQVGADMTVLGSVRRAGKSYRLVVTLVNTAGRELWSKDVEIKRGVVSPQLAARFAAAIAAAAGAGAPAPKPNAVSQTKAEPEVRQVEAYAQPTSEAGDEPARGSQARASRGRSVDGEPELDRDGDRGESLRDPPPVQAAGEVGPPMIDFTLGFTLTWRSYRWCPGVFDCEEQTPAGAGTPLRYTTGTPFGGVNLEADLFPLARNARSYLRGLGLGAGFNLSPSIATAYVDPSTSERVELGSSQNRYWFEGIYRYYYALGSVGAGWVGLRAGYTAYHFSIDENPILTDSQRGGFLATLDIGVPIQSYLKLEARGALIPSAIPGEKERERYGVTAKGGGFNGSVGLTSDLGHPEWHVGAGAFFDFAHFGDRYANYPDVQPEKGRTLEDYKGLSLGLKASY